MQKREEKKSFVEGSDDCLVDIVNDITSQKEF